MKHIKAFESESKPTSKDPQKGDYVFVKKSNNYALNEFFKNNIGKVKSYYQGNPDYWYRIIFTNVPENLKSELLHWSKIKKNEYEYLCQVEDIKIASPEDIERYNLYIAVTKYNL